jgi:hypothetical protein
VNSSPDINYINNDNQIFNAIILNEKYNHLHDVTNNILPNSGLTKSNIKGKTEISCVNDDCLADVMARCIRCSKYYCYKHILLCFQIHPNEIEIIRPMKYRINM